MTITIPLPPRALHPNARPHWGTKAKAAKRYRRDCGIAAKAALNENGPWKPLERATVQATLYYRRHGVRDQDGAISSLKAAYDSLQDAGVIVNDSGLTHLPPLFRVDAEQPRVELEILENVE